MQRRDFAKTVGGIVGTSALGGGALLAATGGASATAGGSISDPAKAVSDDGRIQWVATQTTGRLTWDGFDEPVGYFKILVSVELKRSGNTLWSGTIHRTNKIDTSQGTSWGGSGEEIVLNGEYGDGRAGHIASDTDWGIIQRNRNNIYNNGYALPDNPAPASYLYADTDGSTTKTKVILRSEYVLYANDGSELTGTSGYPDRPEFSTSFVVTVENEAASTGSGDADADGHTGDSADVGV
ncbi:MULTISPECIES: hypothetical protein [Haloarcula]|uniref:hypothetical protein n=1 Tax=Haloarcula TaxID=2237 RepID=UPI0023EA7ECD|nr:hypothetical protein [Halomicroarcula sp. XH51]